jgi:hypothetical protein
VAPEHPGGVSGGERPQLIHQARAAVGGMIRAQPGRGVFPGRAGRLEVVGLQACRRFPRERVARRLVHDARLVLAGQPALHVLAPIDIVLLPETA